MAHEETTKQIVKAIAQAAYNQGRALPLSAEWQDKKQVVDMLTGRLLDHIKNPD